MVAPAFSWRYVHLMAAIYERGPSALFGVSVAILGGCLVAGAVGFVIAARGDTRGAYLVTAPTLVLAGTWLVTRLLDAELLGTRDSRFPEELPLSAAIAVGVILWGFAIAGLGLAITLWQAVEAVRATRDGSAASAEVFSRWVRAPRMRRRLDPWRLLALLLLAKLLWMALGLLSVLPAALGGSLSLWTEVREDGGLSWLLAAAVAVAALVWLSRGCPGPREGGDLVWAIALVVGGLALPELVFQSLSAAYTLGVGDWAFSAANRTEGVQPWAPVVVIVASAVVVVRRWVAGRRDSGTLFLAAFAVWGLVRVPALVMDLVRYPWFPWGMSMPSEATYGPHPGWMATATLDLAITLVMAAVAVTAATRRQGIRLVPVLLLALSSTILVYPGLLVDVLLSAVVGNAVAFVLPFAYLYLLDSEGLNEPGETREKRLIGVVSLSMLALTAGALRAYFGQPVAAEDVSMAAGLLFVPALVTAVVGMLAVRGRRAPHTAGSVRDGRADGDPLRDGLAVDDEVADDL